MSKMNDDDWFEYLRKNSLKDTLSLLKEHYQIGLINKPKFKKMQLILEMRTLHRG